MHEARVCSVPGCWVCEDERARRYDEGRSSSPFPSAPITPETRIDAPINARGWCGVRLAKVAARKGVETLLDASRHTEECWLASRNFGERTLGDLRERLRAAGLGFADHCPGRPRC